MDKSLDDDVIIASFNWVESVSIPIWDTPNGRHVQPSPWRPKAIANKQYKGMKVQPGSGIEWTRNVCGVTVLCG